MINKITPSADSNYWLLKKVGHFQILKTSNNLNLILPTVFEPIEFCVVSLMSPPPIVLPVKEESYGKRMVKVCALFLVQLKQIILIVIFFCFVKSKATL